MRKKQKAQWTEYEFKSGGLKTKFTTPTLKVTKSSIALYKTDFSDGQTVRIYQNGPAIGVVSDATATKKLRGNKCGSRVSINSRKMIRELGLEPGKALPGQKGEVNGKPGWIFS